MFARPLCKEKQISTTTQLHSQMYTSPPPSSHLLATSVVLLLLWIVQLWWSRSRLCCTQSRPSSTGSRGTQTSGVEALGDMDRGEKEPRETEQRLHTFPIPSSTIDQAYLAGLFRPIVTSGQLAAMVQGRDAQIDVELDASCQLPYPWKTRISGSLSSPWWYDGEEDATKVENDLIELAHRADLQGIGRRTLLAFVGQ